MKKIIPEIISLPLPMFCVWVCFKELFFREYPLFTVNQSHWPINDTLTVLTLLILLLSLFSVLLAAYAIFQNSSRPVEANLKSKRRKILVLITFIILVLYVTSVSEAISEAGMSNF